MKEGLRSGNILAKPETDKVSPGRGKKGSDVKQLCFDLNDDATQITDSGNNRCVEDGLDGNERKRSRVDGVNEGDSVVKKRAKKDVQMQNVGRVLRSRSRVEIGGEKEVNKGDIEDKKRSTDGDGGCEKERVVGEGMEETNEVDDGKVEKKVKGKRGRPCKVPENDESLAGERKKLKGKRGRPPKAKTDGSSTDERKKTKNKRGRPSKKMEDRDESDHDRTKRLKGKRGRPSKDQGTNGVVKTKFGRGKKINGLRISRKVKEKRGEKKGSEKRLVRDRIIELLLGAGWTIEYRPRYGREYSDAVYVNPEGKTHWSVTLAYRVLKDHYEEEGGNSNTSTTGFTFTPIPEDELKILKKEIHKTRCDKNKKKSKKKLKDVDTDDGLVAGKKKNKRKLHKGKLNSAASSCDKSLKKGTKGKLLRGKQDNSAGRNRKQGTQNRKRCGLLVRKSVEGSEYESDGYVPYDGKRTVLSWLIDLGTVPLNGKVEYCNRRKTRVMQTGTITRDGICCDCCGEIFSISKFEAHTAAGTDLCYPFQNLYLDSGTSFLQCILNSWNKQDESERKGFHFVDVGGEDPNDDTCGICGDGGDLICCDGCPSTFHQSCLDIKRFPSGKWNCVYCTCKFCGVIDKNTCQMVDHDDSGISTLLVCSLCEEKYHQSCSQAEDAINDDSSSLSFCGKQCQQISERLQMLLGVKHELGEGYTWTLICRADAGSDLSLNHVRQKVECNAKLAVALLVMDECFLPMPDHRSGINLIHNIVYNFGSNFNRLNYGGFFTAILERDDEIISAASIRIHGNKLAEMPFIGTRYMYRRQGMCRRLLTGIESALFSLSVERLVIPAITELKETWTSVFGFKPVEASSKQKMRNMNLLVFPGVDMLQKPVLKHQFAADNLLPAEGLKSIQLEVHHIMDEVADNSNKKCADGSGLNVCREEPVLHDDSAAVESTLQLPVGPSHNTSDVTSKTLKFSESIADTKCINHLGITHDSVQGNDKTTMTPLGSLSAADEQNKEISDYGGEFPHASRLATENIGSEVKSEDVNVGYNNFGNEAFAHQAVEKTTDNQNLDLLQVPKHSGENYCTHESEAKYLMTDNVEVTAACCVTDTKCVNQLGVMHDDVQGVMHDDVQGVMHDDVQGNDRTVMNPLGSVSDGIEENKEFSDCGGEYPHASRLATKSIASEVESEDVIVKGNDVGDEASAHHAFEKSTTDHENLDLLRGSKISCENFEAKYPMTHEVEVAAGSCKNNVESNPLTEEESSCSLDGNPVAGGSQKRAESSKHLVSDSQIQQSSITHCNSESLRDSSPGTAVAPHCSSGGGNSCATPEAIILSNQAN